MQKTKTYIPTAFSASSNGEAGCLSALENNLKENIGITNLKLYLEMKNAKLKFALMAMLLCLCTTGRGQTTGTCGVSAIDGEYGYDETVPDCVSWTYSYGTLTIFGTGYMGNFNIDTAPWRNSYDFDLSQVTGITIYGVKSIGDGAFSSFENLEDVYLIGSTIERIGKDAFGSCPNLTSIDIPGSVTIIDENAFAQCETLSKVTFHEGLEEIGDCAFTACSLTDVFLPEGLQSIGANAFAQISEINNVVIPASVESISSCCFAGDEINYFAYLPDNPGALTDLIEGEDIQPDEKATHYLISMASDIVDDEDKTLENFQNANSEREFKYGENIVPKYEGYTYRIGTICLPFDSEIDVQDNIVAYYDNPDVAFFVVSAKVDDNCIALSMQNPANGKIKLLRGVPYIYKTTRESLYLPFLHEGTTVAQEQNGLVGNIYLSARRDGDTTIKYDSNKELYVVSQNMFIKIGSGQTAKIPQFKAYLDLSSDMPSMTKAEAKARNLVLWGEDGTFEENETSVDDICNADAVYAVGTYSVDGVKRTDKQKGLNIVKMSDGSVKKVMVK